MTSSETRLPDRFSYRFDGPELDEKSLRTRSFAELIFSDFGEAGAGDILVGCTGIRETVVSLNGLRGLILDLTREFALKGIGPGMTVALLRFPRTSELVVAVAYLALSAWGVRVFFPMHLDREGLPHWLLQTEARAVLCAFEELQSDLTLAEDKLWGGIVRDAAAAAGIPALCLDGDFQLTDRIRRCENSPARPENEVSSWRERFANTGLSTPCAVLTTSGTTRRSRLVEYTQGAFLRSCAAWEQAGMLRKEKLGGRGLSPLLAHSLGIRLLWNAVWVRQPLIFFSPEWFLDHPSWIPGLLLRMRPEHISGGPAFLSVFLEFARVFPSLTPELFRHFRGIVSISAAFDTGVAERVKQAFGVRVDNAFATTETQLVTNTLFGGEPPGIGDPLPGASLGLEVREGLPAETFALWVRSPFAASRYLGEETPAQDGWWPTGDLVSFRDGALVAAGREKTDFFNDYFGVKISRFRLREIYRDLLPEADALEFFPLGDEPGLEPGVKAVVFVPEKTGGKVSQAAIRTRFAQRLEALKTELEDFEKRHLAVRRLVVIQGRAPRTIKGEVARERIFANGSIPAGAKVTQRPGIRQLLAMGVELARVLGVKFALALGWKGRAHSTSTRQQSRREHHE